MEDPYRQYFEEMPCYVSVRGPDLRILDANRRFREEFADLGGEPGFNFCKNRTGKSPNCLVEQTFLDGKPRSGEEVLSSKSGEEIRVRVSTVPFRNGAGQVVQVLEMATDINEIHRIRSQFASLELLVGSITHGIRGQITGLDGGAYLVNTGTTKNSPERIQKGWAMVQRNVERIRSMVTDILYYARDRVPQWEPVSIPALVKDLREKMEKKATDPAVEFQIEVAQGAAEFTADPKAIRSMLGNLLEGAFDACRTDPGKEERRVLFSASQNQESTVFTIQDNGIGIDRETRERAFGPFFSAKGGQDTGAGFFISHKIVKSHGGTLEVDSTPGVGTSFVVRIPHRPLQNAGGRQAPDEPARGAPSGETDVLSG
jgi:PAS domain S-box-containing protein